MPCTTSQTHTANKPTSRIRKEDALSQTTRRNPNTTQNGCSAQESPYPPRPARKKAKAGSPSARHLQASSQTRPSTKHPLTAATTAPNQAPRHVFPALALQHQEPAPSPVPVADASVDVAAESI